MPNQNPEQIARDNIDKQLTACGWIIQNIKQVNLSAGIGIAVKEYSTDVGPADYILFVKGKPCGVIEAKREEEGHRINVHESQGEDYANAKLKHLKNEPLPFVYISTGEITRFTDFIDPKPRARETFSFHRPETLRDCLKNDKSLRKRLHDLPVLQTQGLRECQIKAINKLEISFKENRPRALIQMATGLGKTYTAITFIYRLLKYAKAKRVLFLVDTKNLGEQAEQEFMSFDGPYDDKSYNNGFLHYRYRGDNPNHRDNVGLREARRQRKPLVYLFNIFPSKYLASFPVYIVNDEPVKLCFTVAIDDIAYLNVDKVAENSAGTERRSYITQMVLYRAHQKQFRERVIAAYRNQCALCHLKHIELLDAAHIIGDREEHGDPIVQNGLSLCKIHHAAFDNNFIGTNPDYIIKIRTDLLTETDGPMLKYGIQSLNNAKLILPSQRILYPDKERLERRYQDFLKAG